MLPPLSRPPEVRGIIDQKKYFVRHAPRQVGKTTALLTLARELLRDVDGSQDPSKIDGRVDR